MVILVAAREPLTRRALENSMAIILHCEGCHKDIKAPDDAAGKRGKCPFCGHPIYVPVPAAQDDELDFAPTDEEDERRRQREVERLRLQEKALLKEMAGSKSAPPPEEPAPTGAGTLYHHVVNYCLDVAASRLDRLPVHVTHLKKNKPAGLAAVDDLIRGKVIEPVLGKIPPRVLQAFLVQLRDELRAAK